MGQIQDSNSCCMNDKKQSIMELSFQDPLYRTASYESPIPDEVCTFEITATALHENSAEEWSTDNEKNPDICSEPCTNTMKTSRISLCSKRLSMGNKINIFNTLK